MRVEGEGASPCIFILQIFIEHKIFLLATTLPLRLGRTPMDECSAEIMCTSCPPFVGQRMELPTSTTLRVTIGPSASERGYTAITGTLDTIPIWGYHYLGNVVLVPIEAVVYL